MIKVLKVIIFFAISEGVNASIYLFIVIDITLMFINFEIVNVSFSTLIIFFIKFSKSSDLFKFFKNFVAFDLNLKLFNFKAGSLKDICKEIFVIINIKCLFECYFLI